MTKEQKAAKDAARLKEEKEREKAPEEAEREGILIRNVIGTKNLDMLRQYSDSPSFRNKDVGNLMGLGRGDPEVARFVVDFLDKHPEHFTNLVYRAMSPYMPDYASWILAGIKSEDG